MVTDRCEWHRASWCISWDFKTMPLGSWQCPAALAGNGRRQHSRFPLTLESLLPRRR